MKGRRKGEYPVKKATVLKIDGTQKELDHQPTLKEAQGIVGGYIEILRLGLSRYLVVNEDGKPLDLPLNQATSTICSWGIVGDAILLEGWSSVAS